MNPSDPTARPPGLAATLASAPAADPTPPLVSVLIRSMDRDSLAEALAAVAQQRYESIEVVVVNASGQPHRPLGAHCGRFALRLVEPGRPLARPAAANLALDHARGDWLMFLDDDDLIDADHVQRLREALAQAPDHAVAYAGVRVLGADGALQAVIDEPFDGLRFWLANYLPIHAVLFARRLLGPQQRFDEAMAVYEDWDFWFRLARTNAFLHVPGASASYRLIGHSGLSAQRDEATTHQARLAFYRKWRPALDDGTLEALLTQAELARGRARDAGCAAEQAQAAAAQAEAAQHLLQGELAAAGLARAALQRRLARTQALRRGRQAQAQAREQALAAQLQAADQERARLDQERQRLAQLLHAMTHTLSWRVTAPLRELRRAAADPGLRQRLLGLARRAVRALPLSPATRQRIKVRLATQPWGAPLLRWLVTPTPATPAAPAATPAAPPPLDKEAVRAEAETALTRFLASGERLHYAAPVGTPRVSIIVVLFNQAGLSLLCLQALARLRSPTFQLIIVDNASSDRVPQLLERIDGAVIRREADNLGFLRAVNRAAADATGDYLLLLNNDAVVFDDTLARAVARLDAEPDAGAVGGPILLWDGRLQEAGSIVWRDGSCLGYGRGESPDAGPYRYLRDVDYCSGAFLMTRRALFESLGRFDDRYAPAYYEESDYCVRVLEAGHRIVCDPAVRVKHFEFASDVGSGRALALQARNREIFVQRHAGFLAGQLEASPSALLRARQRLRPSQPRVLVIDDRVPVPSLGRGYPRAAAIVHALDAAGAFVTHYPLLTPEESWRTVYETLPERTEVMLGLGLAGLMDFLLARRGLYDVVLVSRPHNMQAVQAIRAARPEVFDGARLVYDAEALFSQRDIARAAVLGPPMDPLAQRAVVATEMRLTEGAQAIVTVSEREARAFRAAGHGEVHVLGHALVPRPGEPGFQARRGFLFVGALEEGLDSPNTDSLLWFLGAVWPRIVEALGEEAVLEVVGPCESSRVRALADERVHIHGRVESVDPFYDAARVFIVPTRFAAGIPHKAHEAAAHGLPMVVSALIADQLGWQAPALASAGDAQGFAQECVALHQDAQRWQSARDAALAAVTRDCDTATFDGVVRALLGHAAAGEARGA